MANAMTNDIETLRALRDELSKVQDDMVRAGFDKGIGYKDYIAALTRTIALLEAVDAAKVDEKVWRGWLVWSKERMRFLYTMWAECQCDVCGDDEECIPCVATPQATHDALTARCAALEQQLRIESMGTSKLHGEMLINPKPISVEDLRLPADVERIAALERQVATMREALRTANIELAALVPKPSEATPKDWPCENPADRECLQSAFEVIRRALAQEGGEDGDAV